MENGLESESWLLGEWNCLMDGIPAITHPPTIMMHPPPAVRIRGRVTLRSYEVGGGMKRIQPMWMDMDMNNKESTSTAHGDGHE